jgi:hypothetical protein
MASTQVHRIHVAAILGQLRGATAWQVHRIHAAAILGQLRGATAWRIHGAARLLRQPRQRRFVARLLR